MPRAFAEETAVTRLGPGSYRAHFSDGWFGPRAPQGGVVAATTLRAIRSEVDRADHRLRTSTTVFTTTVPAGTTHIDVEVLRRGRSVTQAIAAVRGDDGPGHRTMAVLGRERTPPDPALEFTELDAPDAPPPESCPCLPEPRPERSIFDVSFWRNVEARDVRYRYPWEPDWEGGRALGIRWIRYHQTPRLPDGSLDPLAYLPLVDVIPGATSQRLGPGTRPFFAPTLDLTVHFLDVTDQEWILQVLRMRRATHGYGSGEAELWSRDGRLLAHASQTMFYAPYSEGGGAFSERGRPPSEPAPDAISEGGRPPSEPPPDAASA